MRYQILISLSCLSASLAYPLNTDPGNPEKPRPGERRIWAICQRQNRATATPRYICETSAGSPRAADVRRMRDDLKSAEGKRHLMVQNSGPSGCTLIARAEEGQTGAISICGAEGLKYNGWCVGAALTGFVRECQRVIQTEDGGPLVTRVGGRIIYDAWREGKDGEIVIHM